MYQLNGDYDYGEHRYNSRYTSRYTANAMFRMGAIDYDNKYIVTFCGTVSKCRKTVDEANSIYVLPLTEDNKGKNVEKDTWYELSKKLTVRGKSWGKYYFNAIIIEDIIHFVSYAGKYYTMKVKNVLNEIDVGDVDDSSSGLIRLQEFTQSGYRPISSKSVIIDKMGPKIDDL